jgi:5-methylcytosine-specific restriction endonuclease McrA
MYDNLRCTVLNGDWAPLDIVSARKGLILCVKGKAEIVEAHEFAEAHSERDTHPIPSQVVLKYIVKAKRMYNVPAHLNNRNLFIRDNHTCQYCGRHKNQLKQHEILTCDHVHPQEQGGKNLWTNCVTACSRCNNKKSNYLLEEIGMELIGKPPHCPTVFEVWSKNSKPKKKSRM